MMMSRYDRFNAEHVSTPGVAVCAPAVNNLGNFVKPWQAIRICQWRAGVHLSPTFSGRCRSSPS